MVNTTNRAPRQAVSKRCANGCGCNLFSMVTVHNDLVYTGYAPVVDCAIDAADNICRDIGAALTEEFEAAQHMILRGTGINVDDQ